MLFTPSRHGKSETVSRRFPAYALGRDPDAQIIACSYNAGLAADMNRDVQRIIDSEEYQLLFPETRLFGKNIRTIASGSWLRNSDVFEIVGRQGKYIGAGVGCGIVGKGFRYGIIDDPIKSRREAESETYRKHIWDWYISDFYTRRENDDAGILLTVTRWHEDDLAGRLLKQARENPSLPQWTVIRFPAVCEEEDVHPDDPRQVGQALWPRLFDEKALADTRELVGPRDWASMYQQRPSPAEGSVFKKATFATSRKRWTIGGNCGLCWARQPTRTARHAACRPRRAAGSRRLTRP